MLDLDSGLVILLDDLERPVDLVALNLWVVNLAADETLGVEDGVLRVRVVCVLGGVTNTGRQSVSIASCSKCVQL